MYGISGKVDCPTAERVLPAGSSKFAGSLKPLDPTPTEAGWHSAAAQGWRYYRQILYKARPASYFNNVMEEESPGKNIKYSDFYFSFCLDDTTIVVYNRFCLTNLLSISHLDKW